MTSLLQRLFAVAQTALDRHVAMRDFARLTDHHLHDIGLDRSMIEAHVRAALPWPSLFATAPVRLQTSVQGCG
jgi:uncharacterized protein YjiS (DUF1127 family)